MKQSHKYLPFFCKGSIAVCFSRLSPTYPIYMIKYTLFSFIRQSFLLKWTNEKIFLYIWKNCVIMKKLILFHKFIRARSSAGRALRSHRRGRGFESLRVHHVSTSPLIQTVAYFLIIPCPKPLATSDKVRRWVQMSTLPSALFSFLSHCQRPASEFFAPTPLYLLIILQNR